MNVKKIVCIIAIFIMSFSFMGFNSVQADEGSTIIRTINHRKDEELGLEAFDYNIYNQGGLRSGTFYMTTEMFQRQSFFVTINSNKKIHYWYIDKYTSTNKFKVFPDWQGDLKLMSTISNYKNIVKLEYNESTKEWSQVSNTNVQYTYTGSRLYANDIVLKKNCVIELWENESSSNRVDYSLYNTYPTLWSPTMKFIDNYGFRIYLNDFYSHVETEGSSLVTEDFSLLSLNLNVFNLLTDSYYTENVNILEYTDVQQEGDSYYVDILFSDLLNYMNKIDGDFLIFLTSNLQNNVIANKFLDTSNPNFYTFYTKFQSLDYWRYKFDASTRIGKLIPVDENGDPINPDNPDNPDTPGNDPNQRSNRCGRRIRK